MTNFRQVPLEQVKAGVASESKKKPTSEQLRLQADQLRDTAIKLMEHAKLLMEKSKELEEQVSRRNRGDSKQGTKPS